MLPRTHRKWVKRVKRKGMERATKLYEKKKGERKRKRKKRKRRNK